MVNMFMLIIFIGYFKLVVNTTPKKRIKLASLPKQSEKKTLLHEI